MKKGPAGPFSVRLPGAVPIFPGISGTAPFVFRPHFRAQDRFTALPKMRRPDQQR